MKKTLLILMTAAVSLQANAEGTKRVITTSVSRNQTTTTDTPLRFQVNTDVICEAFGLKSEKDFTARLTGGSIQLLGKQGSKNTTSTQHTYGTYGFWFTSSGVPTTASNTARRVGVKYDDGYFHIVHNEQKAKDGDSYTAAEMFVQGNDTVQYTFVVGIGSENKIIATDQPDIVERIDHRTDKVETWTVSPLVCQNEGQPLAQNFIQVMAGDNVTLDCVIPEGSTVARFTWKNRKGKALQTLGKKSEWTIQNIQPEDAGYYVLSGQYRKPGETTNTLIRDCYYYIDVQTEPLGAPFKWEGRVPMFSHDWKNDPDYNYGKWEKPEKLHTVKKKNGQPANSVAGEWWSAFWGDDCNSECGDFATQKKAAENMVKKYDDDFAYIRDHMGWPPDMSARDGYKSFVYIFGSGLANDNESKTTQGGYQGNTRVDGKGYACVWASYYPFSRFRDDADKKWGDGDYQREAMIHEGIHAIFADLNHCQKSAWFHEAGNTWLQSAMNTERYNRYGAPGFLDACPLVAPFMPIECYSGWLQDGSFGGPTAEGVNMFDANGKQICTWRNLLGGNQYGNSFPIILGEICGKGSIPWIWRNCTDYVLKSIGDYLGEETMRQLIMQYRSRMATFDIGGWKPGYRQVMNDNIGVTVKAEWSPYWINVAPFKLTPYQGLKKNDADFWMAPDTLTNPGWSGSNIIPIHVDSKASTATVEFRPEDTEMRAQLCYVTKAGKNYYSQPVQCGKMKIDITDRPANNVIFLVVCNTDYIYTNDNNQAQRKKHWDYRVRFGEGALAVADLYTKWSLNETVLQDKSYNEDVAREESERQHEILTGIDDVATAEPTFYTPGQNGVRLITGNCMAGHPIKVVLSNGLTPADVHVNILGISGIVADEAPLTPDATYMLPAGLPRGVYFIKFTTAKGTVDTYKVYMK